MDPEDLRDLIGAQVRNPETLNRFAGYVAKYMGDVVLIYFGYPQAHEGDPEWAVRAGLALIDAFATLARRHSARCPTRCRVQSQRDLRRSPVMNIRQR
jgi:class 3 adenylate cyclase